MGFSYNVNVLNQKGSPAIYTDTFANRPAFGFAGRLFIANDMAAIYEDTGTAWVLIANVSSGAGTLQQVTTNGNTSNVGISVTAGGVSSNSLTVTTLTPGSVPFVGTAGLITQDNTNLFFDDTNNRLGINTNTPSNNLDVHGSGTSPLIAINNTAGNQSLIGFAKNSTAKWRIGNSSTDTFDVLNVGLTTNAISINSASNCVSFLANLLLKQGTGFQSIATFNGIACDAGGFFFNLGTSTFTAYFNLIGLTAARTYTYPDATGTLALTSNLSAYLPLTGGTLTGTLNGTSANFSSNSCIGTSTPVSRLTIQAPVSANPNTGGLSFNLSNGTTFFTIGVDNTSGDGALLAGSGGAIRFHTNSDMATTGEAMRLSTLRNLLIGSTTDDTVNKLQVTGTGKFTYSASGDMVVARNTAATFTNTCFVAQISDSGSASSYFLYGLTNTGTTKMYIQTDGNIRIAVGATYGIISDQKNKTNILDSTPKLLDLLKLKVKNFGSIENPNEKYIGFIAQEFEEVFPSLVFKNEDFKFNGNEKTSLGTYTKGIKESALIPILVKSIQEQQTIIDSLIKRIELLENK